MSLKVIKVIIIKRELCSVVWLLHYFYTGIFLPYTTGDFYYMLLDGAYTFFKRAK